MRSNVTYFVDYKLSILFGIYTSSKARFDAKVVFIVLEIARSNNPLLLSNRLFSLAFTFLTRKSFKNLT